ncbi:MAG: hypothetical protein GF308_10910 [Candidatus Heimdallarchaeota archaeon]|nr:hypothetical protein [Candidatus Heimdallarchaeota archaeon]
MICQRKSITSIILIVTIISFSTMGNLISVQPNSVRSMEPFFTLVAKTNRGGFRPDYLNFLKQHLARIGINVDVVVQDWFSFVTELIVFRNFDIAYLDFSGSNGDFLSANKEEYISQNTILPDVSKMYSENGTLNVFGYNVDMDWSSELGTGINDYYLSLLKTTEYSDIDELCSYYWTWEGYLMNEILPCVPTFAPKTYTSYWRNLEGYNMSEGLTQSWGKMNWDGSHYGQESTKELVITDSAWIDLNPLFQDDSSSRFISSAILDPLVWCDTDGSVWPHLATSWEIIDKNILRIHLRKGVKWQPDPDELFVDENFDVNDVYFTLYAWSHLSDERDSFNWICGMNIIDNYTIDIHMDSRPSTDEEEPYNNFLGELASRLILPEHYLNQTQLADGVTPDITHESWDWFTSHCFGTGLFQLKTFQEGTETELSLYKNCWLMNHSIDKSNMDVEERFGTKWELEKLRIRIIPDQPTAFLEFEAGKVDMEVVTGYPEMYDEYDLDSDLAIQSDFLPSLGLYAFNLRENRAFIGSLVPCPEDPTMTIGLAIRKAIAYAIDRIEIDNVIHRGEYTITDHPIYLTFDKLCHPNIIEYNYNRERALGYMAKVFPEYWETHSDYPTYANTQNLFLSILVAVIFSIIILALILGLVLCFAIILADIIQKNKK